MYLQEILDDVDSLVPNSFTTTQKIRWINQKQRQLFREYTFPDKVDKFPTVAGLAYYPLPENCPEDRITSITVNNDQYPRLTGEEEATAFFWTTVQGQLMLYPTPDQVVDVVIYHSPRPKDLGTADLTVTPEFPEDYHQLLVLGCAIECAKRIPDVTLANNLTSDYVELSRRANVELGDHTLYNVEERW